MKEGRFAITINFFLGISFFLFLCHLGGCLHMHYYFYFHGLLAFASICLVFIVSWLMCMEYLLFLGALGMHLF